MGLSQGSGSALSSLVVVLVLASVALLLMIGSARATEHIVGDTIGWVVPSVQNVNYTLWSSQNTFHVGDTLLFKYNSLYHNVEEVTEANYNACVVTNPISNHTDGNTTIELTKTGMHYYLCGFPSHCLGGQKVSVNVVTAATSNSTGSSSGVSLLDLNLIFNPSSPLLGIGFLFTLLSLIF